MLLPDRRLLRLLPKVLRARDFHLYLADGKRLTDLWLAGGKAVLGHKPPRVLGELKNAGERGLFAPLPHPAERRLIKALEEFFPGRVFRLYPDEGSLLRALEKAGFAGCPPFYDPAFPADGGAAGADAVVRAGADVSFWRPFLEAPENPPSRPDGAEGSGGKYETARIFIPVLPWPLGPAVLSLDKSVEASFPSGELIPPALLAPAARALYDLTAALKVPGRNRGRYPKIEKALKNGRWRRRGIYLTRSPGPGGEEYKACFLNFLEGGFLLPPSQKEPAILPASMSPGEEAKLAELLGL